MPQEGSPRLSVTECIESLGLGRYSNSSIPAHVLEKAAEQGTRVHQYAEDFLWSRTSHISPQEITGYLDALKVCSHDLDIEEPLLSEYPMRSFVLRVDGILDHFVKIRGVWNVLDFKRGEPSGTYSDGRRYEYHHSVGIQTAGYLELLKQDVNFTQHLPKLADCQRRVIYLRKNGSYRSFLLNKESDQQNFLAIVRLANIKRDTA